MRFDGGSYLVKRAIARSLRVSEILHSGCTTFYRTFRTSVILDIARLGT